MSSIHNSNIALVFISDFHPSLTLPLSTWALAGEYHRTIAPSNRASRLIDPQICSLVGHIVRGRKKASYNHFDSYPSGLGIEIVQFIRSLSAEQLNTMIENLSNIEW
jgi:hypothetical protein